MWSRRRLAMESKVRIRGKEGGVTTYWMSLKLTLRAMRKGKLSQRRWREKMKNFWPICSRGDERRSKKICQMSRKHWSSSPNVAQAKLPNRLSSPNALLGATSLFVDVLFAVSNCGRVSLYLPPYFATAVALLRRTAKKRWQRGTLCPAQLQTVEGHD